ncbi:Aminoglycoside phosphotransferase [Frankia canadensis]|uniref:Aminoglycoside phosphotransferase n=1 Tax=Frankia canadensis TaxID=1836972 RepID=A0A2I2KY60_9ACTN|nr:phosphotransferase family protein [Frankia canadensis]SNQ50604.1 Aminoglycoside phosphotransferase [Frankia canadensis]SOU57894.1 Aminoglycoside phosphotransferase [Frankia canadensis]
MGEFDDLTRLDLVGPLLADAVGDDAWRGVEARLIAGGKSNLTFELVSAAGSMVLRRPPSGHILRGAHDMSREARVQKALMGTDVPVARILLAFDESGPLQVPFYVMQKVEGHAIRDTLPPGYAEDGAGRVAIADALVDTLVELHAVDPDAVGLGDFGRRQGFMARQVRTWTRQWEASKTAEVEAVSELARRLAAYLFAEPARPSVVHGDYRLDNVLMHPSDPSCLRAVLDWELSTLGDPLADLGMLLFYWTQPGEPVPILTPALTAEAGFPDRAYLTERYARRSGADLSDLPAYVAYAHFKFAAIAQGIAARTAAGVMAGQDFGDLSLEVERIATEGLSMWRG